MLQKRDLGAGLVVKRNRFIENGKIPGLLQVGNSSENQPERIIIEAASDVVVTALCQRLVLVVAATVRELG